MKVFSAKFGRVVSFCTTKASTPQKFSPRKSCFHQFAKVFSLESFPLYGSFILCLTQTINEPPVKRRLMWMLCSVTPLCCMQYKTSTALLRDDHFYPYPNTLFFSLILRLLHRNLIPRLLPVFPVEEPGYEATPYHLLPYNLFT